jgi:hypothetical protein
VRSGSQGFLDLGHSSGLREDDRAVAGPERLVAAREHGPAVNTALPSRTIAPMNEPRIGMSLNARPTNSLPGLVVMSSTS